MPSQKAELETTDQGSQTTGLNALVGACYDVCELVQLLCQALQQQRQMRKGRQRTSATMPTRESNGLDKEILLGD